MAGEQQLAFFSTREAQELSVGGEQAEKAWKAIVARRKGAKPDDEQLTIEDEMAYLLTAREVADPR